MSPKKNSTGAVESSHQGTLRMMQQDFLGHKEGTDDKIEKLQILLEKVISGMDVVMKNQIPPWNDEMNEEEGDIVDEGSAGYLGKGVFRDPSHAAWQRKKGDWKPVSKFEERFRSPDYKTHEYTFETQSLRHLKLTFPVFKDGSDALEWLRDCEEYFSIYEVGDSKRAPIAAMHLTGIPRSWYKSFMMGHPLGVTWQQFTQSFVARFGELDTDMVFDRFKRLQQVSSVESYFDEFEKLRGQLLSKIPSLTEEYFMENFIGGLQTEIKGMIRLLEPKTLDQALKLARFYEHSMPSTAKKSVAVGNSYKSNISTSYSPKTQVLSELSGNNKSSMLTQTKPTEVVTTKPRPLTYSQREERRQKGLCFYCDEKFSKGHECKKPQNFLMVAELEEAAEYNGPPKYDEGPDDEKENWQDQDLLLAALGVDKLDNHAPLQFEGVTTSRKIKILVDGGSSINLIKEDLAKELNLQMQLGDPMKVTLPDGSHFVNINRFSEFKWKWEGVEFQAKVWLVKQLEWDVLLGVDWLSKLGDCKCNYQRHTLQFIWKQQEILLGPNSVAEINQMEENWSAVVPLWMEQIIASYEGDKELDIIITERAVVKEGPQEYYLSQGLLQYRGKWVIGSTGGLRRQVFEELHCSGVGGHSGNRATYNRVREYFYWSTMRQDIGRWVRECEVCQQVKGENIKSPGLLKPLEIPNEPWRHIAMDFITGLPKSKGAEVIWVVIDRFSRYGHFLALTHPISAKTLAQAFFDNIYRLHGLPDSIVSDRDSLFLSEFWKTLFKISGTRLNLSSAYHPQSDGGTERVNQCLEQYLRSVTCQNPKNWSSWLPAAEWWYNTTFHTTLNTTPFQVVYGMKPKHLALQSRVHTNLQGVEEMLNERQQQWTLLKESLEVAQVRMKNFADSKRSERVFQVGDWVYLKLQPYRQVTVALRKNMKLAAKYFGPYEVVEKLGPVAYKLALPETSRIHPVFHVSQLKKSFGQGKVYNQLPQVTSQGTFDLNPLRHLDKRSILRNNKVVHQLLVQWRGCSVDEATWEDEDLLECNFPEFLQSCGHD